MLGRSEAREAREALTALSRRYLALRASSIGDPSLAGGLAGIALVQAALDDHFPGAGHDRAARRALDGAIDLLGTTTLEPSLFSGFTGVAWVSELLTGDPALPPEDDPNAEIDEALETWLARTPWTGPRDLVEGLVGIGVYALERMPRASASRMLGLVVDRLAESADGMVNLGVAHGVPGAVAVLGRIAASEVGAPTRSRARALVEKSVAWLLAQELPESAGACFAYAVAPPGDPMGWPARLAWCYGDPGIATALLVAARATGERAWEDAAVRIALRAAKRTEARSGVVDPALCHGASGLAHVFHRLHRATGERRLATAARSWCARALTMRKPRSPDFLTGSGGLTLALLAAVGGDSPWERALVIS